MTAQVMAITSRDQWLSARRKGLGASDANILLSGDQGRITQLWLEKTGQAEGEDLSWSLPVQMGIATEALNIRWLSHVSGIAIETNCGLWSSDATPFMLCSPDGLTPTHFVEVKHVNAFSDIDAVVQRYQPQLHHGMYVTGRTKALLSVFRGTMEHHWYEVALDEWYAADLIERERVFWECVLDKTPPFELPPIAPPVPPERWRVVSFEGNNAWSSLAADWTQNKAAAKTFEKAGKDLKALIEPDVGEAFGHGIEIKRSKAGALTIKESK